MKGKSIRQKRLSMLAGMLLAISSLAWGFDDVKTFNNPQQEQRYQNLIQELRCPKCQNQSIADSDAGISEDLRDIVYEKIVAGQSDDEIRQFLKQRYGDFILYKPEMSGVNLVLWFGPFVGFIVVVGIIIYYVRRSQRRELSLQECDQADDILKKLEGDS